MKRTYRLLMLRGIRKSAGRFLAILGIVALGSGFLAGLMSTTPDMRDSTDAYFDAHNVYDLNIKGTLGVTEADLAAVRALDGVEDAQSASVYDSLLRRQDGESFVVRLYGVDMERLEDEAHINRVTLLAGRLPETPGECLMEIPSSYAGNYGVGDVFAVPESDADAFGVSDFTVVGVARSPLFISIESEPSAVGSGKVALAFYVDKSDFALEAETDIFVTVSGALAENTFGDGYFALVDPVSAALEALGKERSEARREEVIDEANSKLSDARAELEDAKREADEKLSDAQTEIESGYQRLEDGKAELADAKQRLSDAKAELADGRRDYSGGEAEIADGEAEIEENRQKLLDAESDIRGAETEIADGEAKLADAEAEIEENAQKLADGERDYEDGKAKIEDAKAQIEDGAAQLKKGWEDYEDGKYQLRLAESALWAAQSELAAGAAQIEQSRADLETLAATIAALTAAGDPYGNVAALQAQYDGGVLALAAAEAELSAGYADYDAGAQAYGAAEDQLAEAKETLNEKQRELEDAKSELAEKRQELADAEAELLDARAQLAEARAELDTKRQELADAKRELEDAKQEVADGWSQLADAERELADARLTLSDAAVTLSEGETEIADGEAEIADAEQEIADAETELSDAQSQYDEKKAEAEREIADAEAELSDAQRKIADIADAKWYIFDRNDNVGYSSYISNVEKVAALSTVFPIFFFLVSALVVSTTMTRFIEEERPQIGALKSLGLPDGQITAYYVFYSFLASALGCAVGETLGSKLFPAVISRAYGMMYTVPVTETPLRVQVALPIAAAMICCMLLVTLLACAGELRERPAVLLLPKAPKAGKRILLERVGFLWRRLPFIHKVTARNLFRYKKRFCMTVVGIAGCAALLVTGFGLRDSVGDIVDKQFGEIYRYSVALTLSDDAAQLDEGLSSLLADRSIVESCVFVHSENATVLHGGEGECAFYVPREAASLTEALTLRERLSGKEIPFGEGSVVVTEKLAETLGLKVGGGFTLRLEDGREAELTVGGITENYVTAYVYVSPAVYERSFGGAPEYKLALIRTAEGCPLTPDQLSAKMLESDSAGYAMFCGEIQKNFSNAIKSIDYVIIVLIIAAGLLAVIVLYNLTNINICERRKELATIKVLGFYEKEVSSYIFRETNILSLIGAAAGCVGGVWLHSYVVRTVEVDAVMFGRTIYPLSFVYAFAMTAAFTLLVNLIMSRRLKRINMVESMKAND